MQALQCVYLAEAVQVPKWPLLCHLHNTACAELCVMRAQAEMQELRLLGMGHTC